MQLHINVYLHTDVYLHTLSLLKTLLKCTKDFEYLAEDMTKERDCLRCKKHFFWIHLKYHHKLNNILTYILIFTRICNIILKYNIFQYI